MKRLKRHPETRGLLFKTTLVSAVLLLVAAGLFAWLAFFTDACGINEIVVSGNEYLTQQYILERSGVGSYRNLVTLPVGRMAENLEQDPWIREARIGRHLLHKVTINIDERRPLAVVDFSGTALLVDDRGFVIARTTLDDYGDLPRIHGGDASVPQIETKVTNRKVRDCIELIAGMPDGVTGALSLANPFDGRGFVFIARPGYHIVYGSIEESSKKGQVLEAIVKDIENNNRSVAYIDVTVPDSPVIKPN
jgi:cell division protein FtsQ